MEKMVSDVPLFAKAIVLDNYILVREHGIEYKAYPFGWDRKGIIAKLKTQFTLRYQLYDNMSLISEVRYDDTNDLFIIEKAGIVTIIKTSGFWYNKHRYIFKNRFTGIELFDVIDDTLKEVGKAKLGLTVYSIEFEKYPDEFKNIIKEIAVLYVIKRIVWSIIIPI